MAEAAKREPVLRTSYDEMEAYLLLPLINADEEYTISDIMSALSNHRISFGIEQEMILNMITNRVYGKEIKIASGRKCVDGVDAKYTYNFNYDLNRTPKIREDGTVDYWSIHLVEVVEAGQVIAIYSEPQPGVDGMTVTGKLIKAKRGRPLPPIAGRGFTRSEDNRIYTADLAGKIEMKNNRIMISPVYEIFGNADLATGKIDFRGDVIIHGNVTTGASIKCTGTVTIDGTVEGAIINAGKDIILRGGIIGGEKAYIRTKGNIHAKFIEYARVEADGYIEAASAMNSTIISYDKVLFNGRNASVVGGSIYGCAGIEANNFGNLTEIRTEIHAGVHKELREKVYRLEKQIEEHNSLIEKINIGIEQFDQLAKEKGIDGRNDERRVSLLRTRISKQADIATDTDELVKLNGIVENSKNASVKVLHKVYPGVFVCINDSRVLMRTKQESVEFIERSNKVVMLSMLSDIVR